MVFFFFSQISSTIKQTTNRITVVERNEIRTSAPVLAAASTTWRSCAGDIGPVVLAPILGKCCFWSDRTAFVRSLVVELLDEIVEHNNPCRESLVTTARLENGFVRGRDDLDKWETLIVMLPEKISNLPISLFCLSPPENHSKMEFYFVAFSFICNNINVAEWVDGREW